MTKQLKIPKWEKTEPVRLYMYFVMGAFLVIMGGVGSITGMELSNWIWLIGTGLGVVSGTEFARQSVDSPATIERKFEEIARGDDVTGH